MKEGFFGFPTILAAADKRDGRGGGGRGKKGGTPRSPYGNRGKNRGEKQRRGRDADKVKEKQSPEHAPRSIEKATYGVQGQMINVLKDFSISEGILQVEYSLNPKVNTQDSSAEILLTIKSLVVTDGVDAAMVSV